MSVAYCAPECRRQWWIQTALILKDGLGEDPAIYPVGSWQEKVYNIWMGTDEN